jgi:hypothetical protein
MIARDMQRAGAGLRQLEHRFHGVRRNLLPVMD